MTKLLDKNKQEEKENKEEKINEILNELSDCREDERNNQNQTVQVVSTAGTILGVLFSASLFSGGEPNSPFNNVAPLFGLSVLIFCAAFGFITTLGIANVLRYHYIQNLEDKISMLISPNFHKEDLIHWMSFSSPILTRNPYHLKSGYTKVHYIFYGLATICASLFCIYVIIFLYSRIDPHTILDHVLLVIFILTVTISLIVFLLICIKAKKMYMFSLAESFKKKKERLYINNSPILQEFSIIYHLEKTKNNRKNILCIVKYFFYPKLKDLQKNLLFIFGFWSGIFLSSKTFLLTFEQIKLMIITLVVAEGLIYQARYQYNDIRGIKEDLDAEKKDRLPVSILGIEKAVKLSFITIIIKLVVAFIISIYIVSDAIGNILIAFGVLTIVITFLYEFARFKQWTKLIFISVGFGYPIRFLTGMCVAWPTIWKDTLATREVIIITIMLFAYYFVGLFSVSLPWVYEAIAQKQSINCISKIHYVYLLKKIEDRLKNKLLDNISPLQEKGKISDPWNAEFLIAMLLLFLCLVISVQSYSVKNTSFLFIEAGILVSICVICIKLNCNFKCKVSFVIILEIIFLILYIPFNSFPILIYLNQLFFVSIYLFLRYKFSPDFDLSKKIKKIILHFRYKFRKFLSFIFYIAVGKDTYELYRKTSVKKKEKKFFNYKF